MTHFRERFTPSADAEVELIKVLWHDGVGMCLFIKRLERGQFIWPMSAARDCGAHGRAAFDAAGRLRVAGDGAQPEARAGGLMRTWRDHAGVIGCDATTCVIIIALCRSISRHCLTIRLSCSACCGRWCLSCKPRTRSCGC